jgi:hypothetical protein
VNDSSLVTPTMVSGSVSIANGTTSVLSGASELFDLNGNSVLTYDLNPHELVGRQLVFGTQLSKHAESQDLLWDIFGPNAIYEAFLQAGSFSLGYKLGSANWEYETTTMVVPLDQWFLSGFEVSPSGDLLSGFVNGQRVTVPYSLNSSSTVHVNVGKYDSSSASDYLYSISGTITNLYSLPANYSQYQPIAYVWSSLTRTLLTFSFFDPLSMAISGTDATAFLTVEGMVMPVGPFNDLWIGKLTNSPSSVSILFGQVSLSSASSGPNLEWVVLDFAVLLPVVISVWCFYPLLWKKLLHLRAASQ